MPQFTVGMTPQEKIDSLAGANPGARPVCHILAGTNSDYLDILDKLDIRESDIYLVWNDVCGRDFAKMCVVLIATLAGSFNVTRERLMYAANNRGVGIDIDEIMIRLKELTEQTNPSILRDEGLHAMARSFFNIQS